MDVAAVVVTFNRKVLLGECLDALLNQTTPVSMIYLTDNASTDGTHEFLKAGGYLQNDRIRYQLLPENTGGAGGFHAGMKQAYEAGHQWIWLMDDDAEPTLDCLERLAPHLDKTLYGAVGPIVTNANDEIDVESPHRALLINRIDQEYEYNNIVRPVSECEIKNSESMPIDSFSFVGPVFSRELIDSCGLPLAEFFIHDDDLEFSLRCRKHFEFLLVNNARIRHKEASKTLVLDHKRFLWRVSSRTPLNRMWIQYFGFRNRIWLKYHRTTDRSIIGEVQRILRMTVSIICFDDHKFVRLAFWWSAFLDGIRGNFDNSKPRKILDRAG